MLLRKKLRSSMIMFVVSLLALGVAACGGGLDEGDPDAGGSGEKATGTAAEGAPAGMEDLLLTWQREGGIAGFCDSMSITLDGLVLLSSCRNTKLANRAPKPLAGDDLVQFESWVAKFSGFQYEESDPPGVADGMSIRLAFNGRGSEAAAANDKTSMLAYAGRLYDEYSRASP